MERTSDTPVEHDGSAGPSMDEILPDLRIHVLFCAMSVGPDIGASERLYFGHRVAGRAAKGIGAAQAREPLRKYHYGLTDDVTDTEC